MEIVGDFLEINQLKFGYDYQIEATTFTVYARFINKIDLVLFQDAHSYREEAHEMQMIDDNIYQLKLEGDYCGRYYGYRLQRGKHNYYTSDPYALASSAGNKRSYIADLKALKEQVEFTKDYQAKGQNEAIIYETHIRDFTVNADIAHKGKYLGVIEGEGQADRLQYLVDLGITHIHFLPLQKTATLKHEIENCYNWGYDPEQYFVPEEVYSTEPENPESAILEMLTMVDGLHRCGLGVILDVVYNHTYESTWHAFEILAPDIYYRKTIDGSFSNGSGCGNEIQSENSIVQKMIIDSLKHWLTYYQFDGFRFDLMGLIDSDTVIKLTKELREINPKLIIYGEPWTGGLSALALDKQMLKGRQIGTGVAVFNDEYRSALKGDSDGSERGYVIGELKEINRVRLGLLGSIEYDAYNIGFTRNPFETINYVSAHDNLIFSDKLIKAGIDIKEQQIEITKLALGLVIMSFGIPFIQAGTEFMQSKQMDENSYKSGDKINGLNWNLRDEHADLVAWISTLIHLRQSMPCYQEYLQADIRKNVKLIADDKLVGMEIKQDKPKLSYILIIANGSFEERKYALDLQQSTQLLASSGAREINFKDDFYLNPSEMLVLQQDKSFMQKK